MQFLCMWAVKGPIYGRAAEGARGPFAMRLPEGKYYTKQAG